MYSKYYRKQYKVETKEYSYYGACGVGSTDSYNYLQSPVVYSRVGFA